MCLSVCLSVWQGEMQKKKKKESTGLLFLNESLTEEADGNQNADWTVKRGQVVDSIGFNQARRIRRRGTRGVLKQAK